MSRIKLGIIGVGLIGKTHIKIALEIPGFDLVGIADPNPAALNFANNYSLNLYKSHIDLLQDAKPHAVIVATPTKLHVPVGIDCLRAGAHVLVEKPIAESVSAANQLNAEAERARLIVMVGHHRRHFNRIKEARRIIQNGVIGELVGVTVIWATLKPDDYFSTNWRTKLGGGPVLINMIHEIDTLRFICGEISEVRAHNSNIRRGYTVEDTSAVILTFANGALGTVFTTDSAATPWNIEMGIGENSRFPMTGQDCSFFMGNKGSLSFPNLILWSYRDPSAPGWESALVPQPMPVFEHNPFTEQLHHFYGVIVGEQEPLISGVDGTRTLAATLAVLESSKTGKAVKISI